MRRRLALAAVSACLFFAKRALAQSKAVNCFTMEQIYGDTSSATSFNVLERISLLKPDHKVHQVKLCTDSFKVNLLGIQLTYSRYDSAGLPVDLVALDPYGVMTSTC